ncbi:transposable element Tcb2 transposase [Trichonephila clavipes]|nr:transposable element Tcb2 transposase [Trichonephila clavipes]
MHRHRTVAAEQLLESEDIERMDWPARSPDLNPIEHVWDFLGRRLAARTLPPVTIRELLLELQDEWAAMPQQLIDTLILSMGRRYEILLSGEAAAKGSLCSSPTEGGWTMFLWVVMYPARVLFFITIPDSRRTKLRKLFPLTFAMSVIWIGVLSYLAVWMVTVVGKIFSE